MRRARRRIIGIAIALLAISLAMFDAALRFRVLVGHVNYTSPMGIAVFFSAMMLGGVGAVLLVRGPFRMPLGERLFRWAWLGPAGRAFLTVAAGKEVRESGTGPCSRRTVLSI